MNLLSLFFWIVIAGITVLSLLSWLAGLYLRFDKWWHGEN